MAAIWTIAWLKRGPNCKTQPLQKARNMKTSPGLLLVCILNWLCMAMAHAQPAIFQGADMKLGAQLILEHQCASCHVNKVGGNGDAIYKPQGRIQTPALLRGMVEHCNTELNLSLFPEEVTAVAAVLSRDHYRFK